MCLNTKSLSLLIFSGYFPVEDFSSFSIYIYIYISDSSTLAILFARVNYHGWVSRAVFIFLFLSTDISVQYSVLNLIQCYLYPRKASNTPCCSSPSFYCFLFHHIYLVCYANLEGSSWMCLVSLCFLTFFLNMISYPTYFPSHQLSHLTILKNKPSLHLAVSW